jgi:hypothetical protein
LALAFGAIGCAVQTDGSDGTSGEPAGTGTSATRGSATTESAPLAPRPRNHTGGVPDPRCTNSQPQPWSCKIYESAFVLPSDPSGGTAVVGGGGAGTGSGTSNDQEDDRPTSKLAGSQAGGAAR